MAFAQFDPITQARVNRQKALNAAASSPDPLTRYQAKEAAMNDGMSRLGQSLTQQAIANGKIRAELETNYERNFERQIMEKYKPLHR